MTVRAIFELTIRDEEVEVKAVWAKLRSGARQLKRPLCRAVNLVVPD
jgi:hypothetical protein